MKRIVRTFFLVPAAAALVACQSDVKPVGDALAEDSTLALAVLGARPDSGTDIVDLTDLSQDSVESPTIPGDREAPEVATPSRMATQPQPEVLPPKRVAKRSGRGSTLSVKSRPVARRSVQSRPVKRVFATRPSERGSSTPKVPVIAGRAWLLLPVGSEIALEADEQICNSDSGDGFEALVSEDVVMANGVIIPEGAVARGVVVSGSGIQPVLAVEWITFAGRMYEVNTRVTHADAKRSSSRSYCVPEGGRIVAELTTPLRVRLTE